MRNAIIGLAAAVSIITVGTTLSASACPHHEAYGGNAGTRYEGYSYRAPQGEYGRGEYREFGRREYPRREFEGREYPRREFGRREYRREFERHGYPRRELGRGEYLRREHGRGEYGEGGGYRENRD